MLGQDLHTVNTSTMDGSNGHSPSGLSLETEVDIVLLQDDPDNIRESTEQSQVQRSPAIATPLVPVHQVGGCQDPDDLGVTRPGCIVGCSVTVVINSVDINLQIFGKIEVGLDFLRIVFSARLDELNLDFPHFQSEIGELNSTDS